MFTDLIILFTVYNQQPNKLPFFEASNKCQILLNREISREGGTVHHRTRDHNQCF